MGLCPPCVACCCWGSAAAAERTSAAHWGLPAVQQCGCCCCGAAAAAAALLHVHRPWVQAHLPGRAAGGGHIPPKQACSASAAVAVLRSWVRLEQLLHPHSPHKQHLHRHRHQHRHQPWLRPLRQLLCRQLQHARHHPRSLGLCCQRCRRQALPRLLLLSAAPASHVPAWPACG
ncbi:hypothetical protein COO60DRAFT_1487283, partial [Scenedesmus sp. NREL 46B-D3]